MSSTSQIYQRTASRLGDKIHWSMPLGKLRNNTARLVILFLTWRGGTSKPGGLHVLHLYTFWFSPGNATIQSYFSDVYYTTLVYYGMLFEKCVACLAKHLLLHSSVFQELYGRFASREWLDVGIPFAAVERSVSCVFHYDPCVKQKETSELTLVKLGCVCFSIYIAPTLFQ